jgi:hypothetical protein
MDKEHQTIYEKASAPETRKAAQRLEDARRLYPPTQCRHCGIFFISQAQVDRHVAKRHGSTKKASAPETREVDARFVDVIKKHGFPKDPKAGECGPSEGTDFSEPFPSILESAEQERRQERNRQERN